MIPRAPLVLGLAGLIPFLWGAATLFSPALSTWGAVRLGGNLVAPVVLLNYGTIILAFMSGVLWGFATKTHGSRAGVGYALSTLPALWAFFIAGSPPAIWTIYLVAGFLGLLLLDWSFWRQGLAPEWWMRLRLLLTTIVVLCLAPLVL